MTRPERESKGYCCVIMTDGDGRYLLSNEYEQLTAAMRDPNQTHYEATNLYGNITTIKLSCISDVCLITAESLLLMDEDSALREMS